MQVSLVKEFIMSSLALGTLAIVGIKMDADGFQMFQMAHTQCCIVPWICDALVHRGLMAYVSHH